MSKPSVTKQRLDRLLVAQNLAPTRSKAKDLIIDGFVLVNGNRATKPGELYPAESRLALAADAPLNVARSGRKLEHAITAFKVAVAGKTALDLGASTGGFTEVLLAEGATLVYAVDVGRDQLHESLRQNNRVISLEGRDARSLSEADLTPPPDLITVDLSFISIRKALRQPLTLAEPGAALIALVKPQFEVTRKQVNKKGVVSAEVDRVAAIAAVESWLNDQPGWQVQGGTPSPIKGHAGNHEHLLYALKTG